MSENMKILVVDDEADIRVSLGEILEDEGYAVETAATSAQAMQALSSDISLVMLDIKLGADNGLELLHRIRESHPQTPVVMISGHGTVPLTAEAFKLGAHDFLEKPLRLLQVRTSIRNALEAVRLRHRVAQQERERHPRAAYATPVMTALYQQTIRLASVKESVVVMGPSGSGKELIARALHFEGPRANGPFVATNAASLPVNLAESDLFGHEKGAFTGAHARRAGCLEQADGGTLFLDEIGDMDQQIQAKLLRVLETGEFTRLGGAKPTTVNVRVVAATHKDLQALVAENKFRHDLWYRLCAFVLRVPSLDERRDDIPLLAQTFLTAVCTEAGIVRRFSEDAIAALVGRTYPGNIRELKHIVTRAGILSDREVIEAGDIDQAGGSASLPAPTAGPAGGVDYFGMDFRTARDTFERDYLRAALQRHGGNITATAGAVGMAQSNLSRKMKEIGLRG